MAPFDEPIEEDEAPALPAEKPDWLTSLEAASKIKLAGGMPPAESLPEEPVHEEAEQEKEQEQPAPPDWLTASIPEEPAPASKESEPGISPAELPVWLEALRPSEASRTDRTR